MKAVNKKVFKAVAVAVVILIAAVIMYNITYSTRYSYNVLENVETTLDGTSWRQPFGYSAYKIWLSNTTDSDVKAMITDAWGYKDIETVPAGSHIEIVNRKAHPVMYTLNFITDTGKMDGSLSVRLYPAYDDENSETVGKE